MATQVSAADLKNQIKSWIGWLAGELMWVAGIALQIVLFALIVRDLGFTLPYLDIPGQLSQWIYAAGVYYLIRK